MWQGTNSGNWWEHLRAVWSAQPLAGAITVSSCHASPVERLPGCAGSSLICGVDISLLIPEDGSVFLWAQPLTSQHPSFSSEAA